MLIAGIVIGWVHLMAVVVVVGGSFFINFVLPKATQNLAPLEAGAVNATTGETFGKIAWISSILILLTGIARAAGLGLFNSSTLLNTAYGNLILAKSVLFAIIIFNMVGLTRTGMMMAGLAAADGPPDAEAMGKGQKRIKSLSATNLILAVVIIVLAVSMRFIVAPEV